MPDTGTLIQAIESHLAALPQAADSAEGVGRWWLAAQGIVATPQELEQALAQMVQQRRLRCVKLADGNTLYCGARHKPGDAPKWPM